MSMSSPFHGTPATYALVSDRISTDFNQTIEALRLMLATALDVAQIAQHFEFDKTQFADDYYGLPERDRPRMEVLLAEAIVAHNKQEFTLANRLYSRFDRYSGNGVGLRRNTSLEEMIATEVEILVG